MKREIKFRVWDKKANTLNYHDENFSFPYLDYELGEMLANNKRFIFQQFTGLTDKNGKEIYEGDILDWFNPKDSCPVTVNIKNGQIFFNNSPAVWDMGCVFGTDRYNEYGLPAKLEDLKIIGNIFENPTLLS